MLREKILLFILGMGALFGVGSLVQACDENLRNEHSNEFNAFLKDLNNGVLIDASRKLMWKRCLEGQQYRQCGGKAIVLAWQNAQEHVDLINQGAGFLGYRDWRMPTVGELKALLSVECLPRNVKINYFPNLPNKYGIWSSTESGYNAWGIRLPDGHVQRTLKHGGKFVRLVRSMQ